MKIGAAPFLALLLFLLKSADSARDVSMPIPNDVDRNQPFMNDGLDIHELVTIFNNEISSLEDSPTKFSHLCLEISRKAQEVLDDQGLIDELNILASTVCGIPFSDLEAKVHSFKQMFAEGHWLIPTMSENYTVSCDALMLQSNATCRACRNILGNISSQLESTEKKLLIVVFLLKICDIEMELLGDRCKQLVFVFGPLVLTAVQKIMSKDLCYMVHICSDPKNQTQNESLWHTGKAAPHFWDELGVLNLM